MKKPINDFAVSVMAALVPANVLHFGWTAWLTAEQIETGWGGGTGIEMLALVLWFTEFLCLPVLILGLLYFAASFFRQQKRARLMANLILFATLVAQIVATNIFLYF